RLAAISDLGVRPELAGGRRQGTTGPDPPAIRLSPSGRSRNQVASQIGDETVTLQDNLVCPLQYGLRACEPDLLRGLEVDYQQEFSRLLDRQIALLRTLEDLVHVRCGAP